MQQSAFSAQRSAKTKQQLPLLVWLTADG